MLIMMMPWCGQIIWLLASVFAPRGRRWSRAQLTSARSPTLAGPRRDGAAIGAVLWWWME